MSDHIEVNQKSDKKSVSLMGYGLFVKSVSAYLTASIVDAVLTAIFLYLIALRVQQSSNSSSSVPFCAISA